MKKGNSSKRTYPEHRHKYLELGASLKNARQRLLDPDTGTFPQVREMAAQLGVKAGFVYQVEQGIRRPKESKFAQWASVYGIPLVDLWRCIGMIPMNMLTGFKDEIPAGIEPDPFVQLTQQEKLLLIPYLSYVRWQTTLQAASSSLLGDGTREKQS